MPAAAKVLEGRPSGSDATCILDVLHGAQQVQAELLQASCTRRDLIMGLLKCCAQPALEVRVCHKALLPIAFLQSISILTGL